MDKERIDRLKVLLALLLPLLTCQVQWVLWDALKPFAWLLFYPVVYFSSRLAGKRVGLICTVLSALLVTYFFIPPQLSLSGKSLNNMFSVLVFLAMGGLLSFVHDQLARAERGAAQAREEARLADEKLREARISLLEAEQRLNQEKLQENEEQFRLMFMESSVGNAQADPATGRLLKVNPALCRFLGRSEQELLQLTIAEITHPEDREASAARMKALREEGGGIQSEKRYLRPDGTVVFGHATVNLARDPRGRSARTFAVIQDITERRRAEARLRESETRFRSIFDHAPLAVGISTMSDGVMVEANNSWLHLFGYQREEVLGRSTAELGLYPDAAQRERIVAMVQEHKRVVNLAVQLRHKAGAIIEALYSADQVILDNRPCLLVMLTDVSEQRRAERALQQSRQELLEAVQFSQQIITSVQEGIIVYGPDLRFQVWNPYMEQMTGLSAAEVLGRHPLELFPFLLEQGVFELLENALKGETSNTVELPFHVPLTGRSGWASDTRAPLRNAQGEVAGVIGTVRDVTTRRHLEEQLRQAQKMEAVGQLAGGVAHDFNNILQVIIGYGGILQVDGGLGQAQRSQIDQIVLSAERAAQLTRNLLAFSRKQVMAPQRADLCQIVQQVQKFLVRIIGEDINLSMVPGQASELPVLVDSGQIEQVLINLATNARDAMSTGGTLTITTGLAQLDLPLENHFGHAEPGSYACVTMRDTGCGMDEATCSRIFEPFFTTKEVGKGTGLGMAIVYGIVKQHNGFVNVLSEPGLGTAFSVYLPLAEAAGSGTGVRSLRPPPRGGSETILLAEDDPGVRHLMVSLLSQVGYQVIQAEDGQQAVDLFAAHRDSIGLILMDIIMPGKNGRKAGEEISRMQPGVKVLYSSGYTKDFIKERGVSEEGLNLILKPVPPVELLRRIRELLDLEAEEGEPPRMRALP